VFVDVMFTVVLNNVGDNFPIAVTWLLERISLMVPSLALFLNAVLTEDHSSSSPLSSLEELSESGRYRGSLMISDSFTFLRSSTELFRGKMERVSVSLRVPSSPMTKGDRLL
jgi:hypothetical protein